MCVAARECRNARGGVRVSVGARQRAGLQGIPATVGAGVGVSAAAARGSLGARPSASRLYVAERARPRPRDLTVAPLPPFLAPGDVQIAVRSFRTAPRRASRAPRRTGARARRPRRRRDAGERTSGEGGGFQGTRGRPVPLRAALAQRPRRRAQARGGWGEEGDRDRAGRGSAGARAPGRASAGPGRGPRAPPRPRCPGAQAGDLEPPPAAAGPDPTRSGTPERPGGKAKRGSSKPQTRNP